MHTVKLWVRGRGRGAAGCRLPSAKARTGGRVRVKMLFCVFHPFLNSPQNSEYFEDRHFGSDKKILPCRMPKIKSPAPPAPT